MTASTTQVAQIDQKLASVLRGDTPSWPDAWTEPAMQVAVIERANYHGISALLVDAGNILCSWPASVREPLKEQATAQAMWELRHRAILADLLEGLNRAGVSALLLKGSALAYDLYERPFTRTRADTDILIEVADLGQAREIFANKHFNRDIRVEGLADDLHLQEIWQLKCADGTSHDIDLHWQVLNAPALEGVLTFADCRSGLRQLPRLADHAFTADHPTTFLHSALHRAVHIATPYSSGGKDFFGGDRLIWAQDLHRLANAFSNDDWQSLIQISQAKGVSSVCLDGLLFAQDFMATHIPGFVVDALGAPTGVEPTSQYLLRSGQLARAKQDLVAVRGWTRKGAYVMARILPSRAFIRSKYPDMAGHSLVTLYVRRMLDFLRERSNP